MTFQEVSPPISRYCHSGHTAPEFFKETQENGTPRQVKFFQVSGGDTDRVVCELCLILANFMAKCKKEGTL